MSSTRLRIIESIARETALHRGMAAPVMVQSPVCGYQDGPALFAKSPEGLEAMVEVWPAKPTYTDTGARVWASTYAITGRGGDLYDTATDEAAAAYALLAAIGMNEF